MYGHAIFTWSGSAWTPAPFFSPPVALGAAHAVVVDLGELAASPAGAPEIVAVGYDGVRIQTLGGTVLRTFALLTGDRGGSAPSIANVDDDPEPEILVGVDAGLFVYDLECDADPTPAGCGIDTTPGAGRPALPRGVRWADRPPNDAFDFMGATTFDFDADGDVEVVYADECFMRVYDGTTGEVLYSHWRPSRTASEVPIIVGTGDGADTVIAIGLHTASSCTQATGVGGVPAYDPQFPGLGCVSDLDCFGPAGSCRSGRCRCTSDAECCAPGTDCASVGFACHPSEDADGNTCRAVRVPDPSAFARFGALEEGIDVLTDAFGRWAPARAHVSLCMLALLLERTLERRLRKAGKAMTASAALEELAAGHLNMVATGPDEPPAYIATEPSIEHRELLARLRLEHLVDQNQMAARIEPRPAT